MLEVFSRILLMLGVCASFTVSAQENGAWDFSGSGFLTIGAGLMLGGTRAPVLDQQCPCFVSDYAQNAVYDGRGGLQFTPDSKLGLQGTITAPDPRFSLTTQTVSRGSQKGELDLEWLYGTYQISDTTTLQLGRKRLPLFYYSETQDVGFTLPWTHLPPQVYGWEMVNYNGASLQQRGQYQDWDYTANILAGNAHAAPRDAGYWQIYNGQTSLTRVDWKNIVGANIVLSKDWFETRLAYLQSETQRTTNGVFNPATQSLQPVNDPFLNGKVTRQQIYTAAINLDFSDWQVNSELLYIDRPGANFKDHASRLAATRRFGAWEATLGVSEYHGQAVVAQGGDPLAQESHLNRSLTGRYSLTPRSDIKLQVDAQHDMGGINWTPKYGDSRLLSFAYDRIF